MGFILKPYSCTLYFHAFFLIKTLFWKYYDFIISHYDIFPPDFKWWFHSFSNYDIIFTRVRHYSQKVFALFVFNFILFKIMGFIFILYNFILTPFPPLWNYSHNIVALFSKYEIFIMFQLYSRKIMVFIHKFYTFTLIQYYIFPPFLNSDIFIVIFVFFLKIWHYCHNITTSLL